jgi:hypothetical protein
MTALAADYVRPMKGTKHRTRNFKMGVYKAYRGSMGAVDAVGYARAAANVAGLRVVGRIDGSPDSALSTDALDNTGGDAGDKSFNADMGCFKYANSGTNALTQADVGRLCFVEDDNTVASYASAGVVAGLVVAVETDGVFVEHLDVHEIFGIDALVNAGAMSPSTKLTTWSVTGTVAGTLANGLYNGQMKFIRCTVAATSPVGTLTPATALGFTTILFDAVGECALLMWVDGASPGWTLLMSSGATPS